jgi:membrane-associated phospholipid phosphatase
MVGAVTERLRHLAAIAAGCAIGFAATPAVAADAPFPAPAAPLLAAPPSGPAFQLDLAIDLPLLGLSGVLALARFARTEGAFCAPLCDRNDVNGLDRTTAGYWSPGWQSASNFGLLALGVGAAAVLVADEGVRHAANDAVVVAESALVAIAVTSVMEQAVERPRPFLYGDNAPLSTRTSTDAALSFLSSHAAASFAIAASTTMTMLRLHPGTNRPWLVLATGGALATFISVARVLGGMHFITDSIGGAVVGASTGVLVPALHRSPVAVVPMASLADERGGGVHGIGVVARF